MARSSFRLRSLPTLPFVLLGVVACSSADLTGPGADSDDGTNTSGSRGDGDGVIGDPMMPGDGDGDVSSTGGLGGDGDGDSTLTGGAPGDGDGDTAGTGGDDPASGGGTSTGGSGATGGATSTGGAPTGGAASTGGGSSGGASSGGASGTGGNMSTGGNPGTGGAPMCDNSYMSFSCGTLGTWPAEQASLEEDVLALVNMHRQNGYTCGGDVMAPTTPLTMDATLRCAARVHSQDMANRQFFSHATWNPNACTCSKDDDCPSGMMCDNESGSLTPERCGKSPGTRVSDIGGPSGAGWENIAAGRDTAAGVMDQWMNSAGHCRNIMNPNLKTIGIGYAVTNEGYRHYWTQSFDN